MFVILNGAACASLITPQSQRNSRQLQSPTFSSRYASIKAVSLFWVKSDPSFYRPLWRKLRSKAPNPPTDLKELLPPKKELKAIMAYSAKPNSRAEEEIAGYRDALSLIHEQHDFIPVTPSVILQLHRDLMAHDSNLVWGPLER